MLKILLARLQQYVNQELPDVQVGFRKIEEPEIKLPTSTGKSIEKAREFQKNIYYFFIDYAIAFVWITANCGKSLKRWEYQTTQPAS